MRLIQRLALCRRILSVKTGNLMAHTERELPKPNGDEMQALMNQQLRELVLVFSTHGHSGFSAGLAIHSLKQLLAYEPMRPLTGEPDEWMEVGQGLFQNVRCSRVFKGDPEYLNGQAYDIEGVVFREPSGACYTSHASRVPVAFPYTPSREYRDVAA